MYMPVIEGKGIMSPGGDNQIKLPCLDFELFWFIYDDHAKPIAQHALEMRTTFLFFSS